MLDLGSIVTHNNTAQELSLSIVSAIQELAESQNCLLQCQTTLRDARDVILREFAADPKPLGANEAAREAAIRGRTAQEQHAVDAAESELVSARSYLEACKASWEYGKVTLRLMELQLEVEKQSL